VLPDERSTPSHPVTNSTDVPYNFGSHSTDIRSFLERLNRLLIRRIECQIVRKSKRIRNVVFERLLVSRIVSVRLFRALRKFRFEQFTADGRSSKHVGRPLRYELNSYKTNTLHVVVGIKPSELSRSDFRSFLVKRYDRFWTDLLLLHGNTFSFDERRLAECAYVKGFLYGFVDVMDESHWIFGGLPQKQFMMAFYSIYPR